MSAVGKSNISTSCEPPVLFLWAFPRCVLPGTATDRGEQAEQWGVQKTASSSLYGGVFSWGGLSAECDEWWQPAAQEHCPTPGAQELLNTAGRILGNWWTDGSGPWTCTENRGGDYYLRPYSLLLPAVSQVSWCRSSCGNGVFRWLRDEDVFK